MALITIENLHIHTHDEKLLKSMDRKLDTLLHREHVHGYLSNFKLYNGSNLLFTINGKLIPMAITLKDTQKFTAQLSFVDSKGAATDAASVELISNNTEACTVEYDDPTNTITGVAGLPGVAALSIVAKDADGNTLPFEDVAIEVTAGNAVSGSLGNVEITENTPA